MFYNKNKLQINLRKSVAINLGLGGSYRAIATNIFLFYKQEAPTGANSNVLAFTNPEIYVFTASRKREYLWLPMSL
jgi:hypothetical protein